MVFSSSVRMLKQALYCSCSPKLKMKIPLLERVFVFFDIPPPPILRFSSCVSLPSSLLLLKWGGLSSPSFSSSLVELTGLLQSNSFSSSPNRPPPPPPENTKDTGLLQSKSSSSLLEIGLDQSGSSESASFAPNEKSSPKVPL